MPSHRRLAWALALLTGLASTTMAQGPSRKYGDLLKRLPETANAMMLVDVDGLLDSPLGKREKWRAAAADRPAGVLGVSNDASKFVVAAGIDLSTGAERWKLGMLQTHAKPPSLSVLAAREGGYVEKVQTENVAWTPRNFYLLSFPEQIVGFVVPSDRQAMGGWLFKTLVKPRAFPPGWADKAIFRADAGSQIVLAVNLDQAVSAKGSEAWLKTFEIPNVKRNEINFPLQASTLAGAKLAFLQVDVTETIKGTLRIEFDTYNTLSLLRPIARDVVMATLADYGAAVDDLAKWSFDIKENSITMSGALSEDAVRRIISIVSAPRLSSGEDSSQGAQAAPTEPAKADAPPAATTPADGLKASQKYYRSVVGIVDNLKRQSPQSTRSTRLWYDRSAKEIEDLPLLGVDTDLLDWGAKMAITLRDMSTGINYAAKDKTYRIAGDANGFYGGYGYANSKAYDAAVISKQSDAILNVQVDQRWQVVQTAIADMRRQMVAKYKVEF